MPAQKSQKHAQCFQMKEREMGKGKKRPALKRNRSVTSVHDNFDSGRL